MKKIAIIILILIVYAGYSSAAFDTINASARLLGMGNSFVAVADDVNCIFDNPSGLANLNSWQATFTGSKLYWGISDMGEGFAAVSMPIKGMGGVGFGWYSFADTLYYEDEFILAYAYPLPILKNTAIAVSGKYLMKNYVANEWTAANPDFTSLSSNAFSLGLSFITSILKELSVGLFIDDINQPVVGAFDLTEKLPITYRAGVKYVYDPFTIISTEFYYRDVDYKLFVGMENSSFKIGNTGLFLLRVGGGFGSDSYLDLTAGVGFRFNIPYLNVGGQFDYGFLMPFNFASGSSGTHMISLTLTELYKSLINNDTKQDVKYLRSPQKK